MIKQILIISVIGWTLLSGCTTSEPPIASSIEMSWSFDSLDTHSGLSVTTFTLTNHSAREISGTDWAIYFSQMTRPREITTEGSGLHIESITGDYRKIYPDSSFVPIAPGGQRSFQVTYGGFAGRISLAPVGAYYINSATGSSSDHVIAIKENNVFPGLKRPEIQELLLEDVQMRYQENARNVSHVANVASEKLLHLIPSPVSFEPNGRHMTVSGKIGISYSDGLASEVNMLRDQLKKVFTGKIEMGENLVGAQILISIDEDIEGDEAYHLNVANGVIEILGSDAAGVFYGIQSLARLYPVDNYRDPKNYLTVMGCSITDIPRFAYRGLQLDVARNFHSLAQVKEVINQMSYYKLNKLHLSLTNDEGWRLEIPGLPELTEVGSRRGHTLDELDMLYPAYGSGPFADPDRGAGTGYYSRAEFIALLRYANAHHVEVITEIDVPGHARAAIKAMIARQNKFEKSGDPAQAIEYLLSDPDDASEYSSAQHYDDNVVCICQESTYHFIEKVVDEIVSIYREAGAPLTAIHSGGDEVPHGAWRKSPICVNMISQNAQLDSADDLTPYFFNRFMTILEKYDLTSAGWEEIVLKTSETGNNEKEINFDFAGKNVLPYVWNSVWGWGSEDMAYRLANGGYPIIMCNSGDLYFDLAYNRDPSEPGLTWSGYVDTRSAFEFEPMDMFSTATEKYNGELLEPEYIAGKVRLQPSARKNIRGIQGQLWSETVRNSDRLDYYLFPKLLGLAERAWSKAPGWTSPDSKSDRLNAIHADWAIFANTVGAVELPLLDYFDGGVAYRIPMPGAVYLSGQLEANVRYAGLEIRYTIDGTEPTVSSTLYDGSVRVSADEIRLRAFNALGRGGRSSVVRAD